MLPFTSNFSAEAKHQGKQKYRCEKGTENENKPTMTSSESTALHVVSLSPPLECKLLWHGTLPALCYHTQEPSLVLSHRHGRMPAHPKPLINICWMKENAMPRVKGTFFFTILNLLTVHTWNIHWFKHNSHLCLLLSSFYSSKKAKRFLGTLQFVIQAKERHERSRIGSSLFPKGKMNGYENKINSIFSPVLVIWNLSTGSGWVGNSPELHRPKQSYLCIVIKSFGWTVSAKFFSSHVNDFLVDKASSSTFQIKISGRF
jgi:hypothetical protein